MHVAALHCLGGGVVFGHQVHPVVQQLAGFVVAPDVDLGLTQSALGIVGEIGRDRGGQIGGRCRFKAVVTVVGVLPMAGRGQVAVGIVAGRCAGLADACDGGVLVQAIGAVAGGGVGFGGACPLVQVIVPGVLDNLLGLPVFTLPVIRLTCKI